MPVTIQDEPNDISVLRISGTLTRSEFAAKQSEIAGKINTGARPRLLAILEDFQGWEHGADWNDIDFIITHSDEIAKIAVVAEPEWETKALAFAGAGIRRAPVKFFSTKDLATARAWLAE